MDKAASPIVAFWSFPLKGEPGKSGLVVARPDILGLFILNSSARFIWEFLQTNEQNDQLIQAYSSYFGVSIGHAAADVEQTLHSWSNDLLSPLRDIQPPSPVPPQPSDFQFSSCYTVGTKSFRLLTNDAEFEDEIAPRLLHLQTHTRQVDSIFRVFRYDGRFRVFLDETLIDDEADVTVVRTIVLQEMARASQPGIDWMAILHAGACGTSSHCIIMPAATNAGKSTLAAALMHSGLELFSDDSAAVDQRSQQIIALPFAIMLREGSWSALGRYFPDLKNAPVLERNGDRVRFLAPSATKGGRATPKCLLFVQYEQGASTDLQGLTAFESLLGLQQSGFWLPHDQTTIGSFLSWVQSMPAFKLTYSSLDDAIAVVHGLLRADLTTNEILSDRFAAAHN